MARVGKLNPITQQIDYYNATIIKVPVAIAASDATVQSLAVKAAISGADIYTENGIINYCVGYGYVTTQEILALDAIAGIIIVDAPPILIRLSAQDLESDVPEGIRNRIDPADNSVRWWKFWPDSYHRFIEAADGYSLIEGSASDGTELTIAEWKALIAAGYEFKVKGQHADWLIPQQGQGGDLGEGSE